MRLVTTLCVNEFPDYVNNCPCTFTKEYMMKKIRKERESLIKEILNSFEQNRITKQPIKFVDTKETEVTELEYDTDFFRYPDEVNEEFLGLCTKKKSE